MVVGAKHDEARRSLSALIAQSASNERTEEIEAAQREVNAYFNRMGQNTLYCSPSL
jgi:hypothetical protein